MKQSELKPCAACGKGVMHAGVPIFYRVKIESMCIDAGAVKRQHGLEMMLGGNAALAFHMGPQEELAKAISEHECIVCSDCATDQRPLLLLLEGDGREIARPDCAVSDKGEGDE